MQQPEIVVFYSYFPGDGDLWEKLDQHLSPFILDRPIKRLHRGNIDAGKSIQKQIDRFIDVADLILLLVSPDFLNDPECRRQTERAMDRLEQGAFVIPIILRTCGWRNARFGGLQYLPRTANPIGELEEQSRDKALTDVAGELDKIIVASSYHTSTKQQLVSGESLRDDYSEPNKHPSEEQTERPTARSKSYKGGYALAVDIGRSHVTSCLAKMDSEIIDCHVEAPLDTAQMGGEKTLLYVAESLSRLADRNHVSWELVRGIALSVPGVPHGRYLVSPLMMRKWFRVDIPTTLRSKLPKTQKPLPIYLNNDANMGAFGESRRHVRGKPIQDLVYIKVGTGIGAGLILGGRLYRGHSGAAGEFGHILLEPDTGGLAPCVSCEKSGCLESLAGERAIIRDVYRLRKEEREEVSNGITILEVVEAARRGDRTCREALENAGKRIGRAIGSCLVNIYNPSHIILDGSVIRADEQGEQLLYDTLCRSAALSSLPVAMQDTRIDLALLGDKAVAHGAIMTVIEKYKSK